MNVGIIGAMDIEVEHYLEKLIDQSTKVHQGMEYHTGKLAGRDVVVVKSGIGKVNAAMCAQTLIELFHVDSIIFTGVAGALDPELDIHDIVISKDSIQHDVDGTGFGYKKGQILGTDYINFEADEELINLAKESSKLLGIKAVIGRILSGDQFIHDKSHSKQIREEFNGSCVEMEGAAVAQVCTLSDIPHVIIRSISDKANESAQINFDEFVKVAADKSYLMVMNMLQKMDKKNHEETICAIKDKIRTVPHWPKEGIMFRDITTLLQDPEGFNDLVNALYKQYMSEGIDIVAGIESRGFITGAVLANKLGVGFALIRKPNKLPGEKVSEEYTLEYGTDKIEMHKDTIKKGQRVLLVDDLIATGGTAIAACKLVEKVGGVVKSCCFIVDLPDLGGSKLLKDTGYDVRHLIEFEGD